MEGEVAAAQQALAAEKDARQRAQQEAAAVRQALEGEQEARQHAESKVVAAQQAFAAMKEVRKCVEGELAAARQTSAAKACALAAKVAQLEKQLQAKEKTVVVVPPQEELSIAEEQQGMAATLSPHKEAETEKGKVHHMEREVVVPRQSRTAPYSLTGLTFGAVAGAAFLSLLSTKGLQGFLRGPGSKR
mmetsp:Transcript_48039/g.82568  ORF Transcript_48039/g.82568 Transcript_48039/m.82568 type:complete len:189 (-) Transcript_48039:222-788(-)